MDSARTDLVNVLNAAASQNQQLTAEATATLKGYETSPGFYSLLQDVYLDKSLPAEVRQVAIIYLKNGIDKYWRRTAKNGIQPEEKARIRSRLLEGFDEPSRLLANQNAVSASRIARLDYPIDWPSLFSDLSGIIRSAAAASDSSSRLRLQRGLQVLHQVVKALCSLRLMKARQNLQQVTPELVRFVGEVYVHHAEDWVGMVGAGVEQADPALLESSMEISIFALKTLRRLVVHGYEFANRATEAKAFFQLSHSHLGRFMNVYSPAPSPYTVVIRKHILLFGKLFLDLSQHQPSSFMLLPDAVALLRTYWNTIESQAEAFNTTEKDEHREFLEKLCIQGMQLLKWCAKTLTNPAPAIKLREKDEKEEVQAAARVLKEEVFTPDMLTRSMEVLITKYLVLRPDDLQMWEDDGEEWMNEEEQDAWEYQLRPCAERLLLELMQHFRQLLTAPLLGVLQSLANPTDLNGLLLKDAVYNAFGLAASVLFDAVDFDAIITGQLVNEVQIQEPMYKIIRRRITILIGQWISVKVSKPVRVHVYTIFQHLLNPNDPINDFVVRYTAAQYLKACVDEWDFETDVFLPFMKDVLERTIALMGEAEQIESRMKILQVIDVIIDRVELRVAPYAQRIAELLPPLWEQSGDQHLFKSSILVTLTKLVNAMRENSVGFYPMVLPLIQYSCDPTQDAHVYLLEDALELWSAVLQMAPSSTPELLSLMPSAIQCLGIGSEILRRVLQIVESYCLLDLDGVVSQYAVPLFTALAALLGGLKPETSQAIGYVAETIFQGAPVQGYAEALAQTGFVSKLILGVLDDKEQTIVLTHYLSMLSRIAMQDANLLLQYIELVSQQNHAVPRPVITAVIDQWVLKFDNVGHPKHRKLIAMGLTATLRTNNADVFGRLGSLMSVWFDVLSEIKESDGDALVYWQNDDAAYDYADVDTPESKRRRELLKADAVHTVELKEYVRKTMAQVEAENGGSEAFKQRWLVQVDSALLDQMSTVL
ncbi:ARM repeat-containing protein [Saitoella complicata NRRL Y-17804]|uniref:Importin N-terminal domain-containing protein n=1 Tax=Saitoella complicata (strain BCRC 22490 / CBS 7301 / JCM 7358 / NBRC 10748 / NRRL Y-17804) TaxID=698492 RepID=A0A0E9NL99_SAICN|nr:ARM repeat-containing protein [Saitoella complicata NRRL Y-17804]ODQ50257.1 ARM repeat-containing protein [Saitoella complicata NRRL Y-17804]GAO50190.1 hypothetical protein G7K_4324-t1 [Saitoella complicata NRRL Y-17804]